MSSFYMAALRQQVAGERETIIEFYALLPVLIDARFE